MSSGNLELILTACPFCGSSNVGLPFDDRPCHWVTCYDCGADGPLIDKKKKDPGELAVLMWNRRQLLQLGE